MSSSGLWGRRWSPDEIAALVGGEIDLDWNAVNAVAVALAESGGFEHAVNLVDHDPAAVTYLSLDVGLFQVNTYWHDLPLAASLTPERQVKYVLQLAKRRDGWGYDWSLWTTWKTGAAKRFLGEARHAVNRVRAARGLKPI